KEEETQLEIRDPRNPGDGFGVNRVQGEKSAGDQREQAILEKMFGYDEEQQHDCYVQDQIHEMEAEGQRAEDFVADQVGESHQRPIVVADSLRALKTPDVAPENPAQILKVMDIRIFQNLLPVVIDEAVGERIEVGQGRHQDQYEEDDGIVLAGLSAQPTEHEIMVAEGTGGI